MAKLIGQKIRELRQNKGLTLDELAAATESSKSYIWELESKENARPSAAKAEKIATALGVTAEYLIDDSKESPDVDVRDKAFFRKFQALDDSTKEKLEGILDVLNKE